MTTHTTTTTTRMRPATSNQGARITAAMTGAEDYTTGIDYNLPTELAHEKAARIIARNALGCDFAIHNIGVTKSQRGYRFRVTTR